MPWPAPAPALVPAPAEAVSALLEVSNEVDYATIELVVVGVSEVTVAPADEVVTRCRSSLDRDDVALLVEVFLTTDDLNLTLASRPQRWR